MVEQKVNSTISKLVLFGLPAVTLFLVINSVTDPVNAPKLAALGTLSGSILLLLLVFKIRYLQEYLRGVLILASLFLAALINSVMNSNSPLSQNVYGIYGRNTGFLTYFCLLIILIGVAAASDITILKKLVYGFLFAGIVNALYCLWVLIFGDFISWNNPYGSILGLFGNPNFISAFLGMFISACTAYALSMQVKWKMRIALMSLSLVALLEVIQSRSIQGIAVTFFGASLAIYFYLRAKFDSQLPSLTFLLVSMLGGTYGVLGALQKGPLDFIYKKSVSLRGAYWQTGINIGSDRPLTGVGMDSYGDWYRAYRPPVALIDTPGPNVTTNAAHNVFLDLFSYGGYPLLLSYISLLALGGIAVIKVISRGQKEYDPLFVGLLAIWSTYLLQSMISINQIGLAIWGWSSTGALIAYEVISRRVPPEKSLKSEGNQKRANSTKSFISPNLLAGIGALIGVLIAVPPLSGDSKWKSALDSRNVTNIEKALIPSYLNPSSSFKYGTAISLLSENGFQELAYKYAKIAVEFNPDFADAWRQLYTVQLSTEIDKSEAMKNLKRLDPNNPDPLGLTP
jgi:O-antigen ligase